MMKLGAFVLLFVAACGVGDDSTPPDDKTPRTCNAKGTITGTWTSSMADPDLDGDGAPDVLGCWDVGTWTFTATLTDAGNCSPAPTLLPSYSFVATRTITPAGCTQGPNTTCELTDESWSYTTNAATHNRTKTSEGGGGICEGQLELFSDDGKSVWTFTPVLTSYNDTAMTTAVLGGQFEFATYPDDQWTQSN